MAVLAEKYSDGAELDVTVLDQSDEQPDTQEPAAEKANPEQPATEPETKAGPEKPAEESKEAAKPDEKPDGAPVDWEKRFKDTQASFTKAAQEAATLRREKMRLEAELNLTNAKAKVGNGFEELDESDLADLKSNDPDAYIEYVQRKRDYETGSKQVEAVQQETVVAMNNLNTLSAISGLIPDVTIDFTKAVIQQDKRVIDFIQSEEFAAAAAYLDANMRPDANGVYSPQQIEHAFYIANREKLAAQDRLMTAEQMKTKITNASTSGSVLDRVPAAPPPATGKAKWEKMSKTDLESLGADELATAEKELGL